MSEEEYTDEEQEERQKIETTLDKFSRIGLIGESKIMPNGERAWLIGPEHQALMLEILKHPEQWNKVPSFREPEFQIRLLNLRLEAIARGLIKPETGEE